MNNNVRGERDSPQSKIGRVTGRIAQGEIGEVIVEIRGGSEAFLAQAFDKQNTYERGDIVRIIQYHPPRSVIVAKISEEKTL